jgi:hypothetical protein
VLEGPAVAAFFATDLFKQYAGGLWRASECSYVYGPDGQPDAGRL